MSEDQNGSAGVPAPKEARLEAILRSVPGYMSSTAIDRALSEVSNLGVELEADPTQSHLGTKYLQEVLAKCRQHLNRAHIYLQQLRIYEKGLRLKMRERELDLDLKVKAKLADDKLVRQQPSIEDRKALAASMLLEEHEDLAGLRVEQLNVETSVKLIKSAYDHLNRTSQDIRMQRQLVRDDKEVFGAEGGGLVRPSPKPDGTLPEGQAPLATDPLADPRDLLDESKRPDDMPAPVSDAHADLITSFLKANPVRPPEEPKPARPAAPARAPSEPELAVTRVSYDELLR